MDGEWKIEAIPDIEFLKTSNTEKTIQGVAFMAVAQLNCYKATAGVPDLTAACCRSWTFAVNMF